MLFSMKSALTGMKENFKEASICIPLKAKHVEHFSSTYWPFVFLCLRTVFRVYYSTYFSLMFNFLSFVFGFHKLAIMDSVG